MSPDATARFYRTPRGSEAARLLIAAVEAGWSDYRGLRVAVLGPTGAALAGLATDADRVVGLHPGVPERDATSRHLRVGVEPEALPVADSVFDRVLLLHTLENAEDEAAVLRDVWRMTAPEGRILLIAPNRLGPWAWFGRSPFRQGRPLTAMGVRQRLAAAAFEPRKVWGALHAPPLPQALYLRVAATWERLPLLFPGVVLAEGRKRLHVPTNIPTERLARQLRPYLIHR
ncbi:MAG: methyltransferase domain-containing protein [Rhodospirillales bacterium]|nr:methyltransferase domain-containing protein [Rhodospirillales bacterium]